MLDSLRGVRTLVIVSLLSVGCDGLVDGGGRLRVIPLPAGSVGEFMSSEGVPLLREFQLVLSVPEQDLEIFAIRFGRENDCPSGCFYSRASGIRVGDQVGWIEMENYGAFPNDAPLVFFSLNSGESYVTSADFLTRILEEDLLVDPLREVLAADPNTPVDALFRVAVTLESHGTPRLGLLLLANVTVRGERDVLTHMAQVSSPTWDFTEVRDLAGQLLDELD